MSGRRPALPLALVLSLLLGGCQRASLPFGSEPTATASPTPRDTAIAATPTEARRLPHVALEALDGTQLKLWHAFPPPVAELLNAQIAQFNLENPWGVSVRATSHPEYSSLFDATTLALSEQDGPDLVAALPEHIRAWDGDGLVADLEPYFADREHGYTAEQQQDFPPAFLDQDRDGGRLLALPAQRSARLLFYNETWGRLLDFPGQPQTPTDFTRQACAANRSFKRDSDQANDGFGGWIVDTDYQSVLAWILANGGSVHADAGYTFQTEANQAALEFIKGLYDSSCAWITSEPLAYNQFARRLALFSTGDLSELDAQAEAFARAPADTSGDQWTVAAFPGAQEPAIVTYGPSYAVFKSAAETELAAWLFVRWLLEPGRQAPWVRATGLFPLRSSALPFLEDYSSAHPQWQEAVALLENARPVPPLASWRTMKYVLGDGANSIFRVDLPVTQIPSVLEEMDETAVELEGQ
jgi:ABC-type glycerol-3-phosphate transport system substrate-binding protein